jgi:hypothetical protein
LRSGTSRGVRKVFMSVSRGADEEIVLAGSAAPARKRFRTVPGALDDARTRADTVAIPASILDFLYSHTRHPCTSRFQWERDVRVATALDENFMRFGCMPLFKDIGRRVGNAAREALVRELKSAGTLVLGFHGGFGYARRRLFARLFPESIIIGATGKHTATDGAHALFAAREALLQDGLVLIAPDGRFGKESGTISVLGAQLPVTDGAPFLAHTTRCRVAWLALIRTEDKFALETMPAPRAEEGERFAGYKERLYRFYADRLEEAFTGDPANLPLTANWKLTFNAMLAGKVYRFRRPTR